MGRKYPRKHTSSHNKALVISIQFPLRQKCDNTHKKDTLQAHYKHLESFCLHKYTFKPSHQVKYRQEKRNRNSGLNTVRRW